MHCWVIVDDFQFMKRLRMGGPMVYDLVQHLQSSVLPQHSIEYRERLTYAEQGQQVWGPPYAVLGAFHHLQQNQDLLGINLDTLFITTLCEYTRTIVDDVIQQLEVKEHVRERREYLTYLHTVRNRVWAWEVSTREMSTLIMSLPEMDSWD